MEIKNYGCRHLDFPLHTLTFRAPALGPPPVSPRQQNLRLITVSVSQVREGMLFYLHHQLKPRDNADRTNQSARD